MTEPREFPPPRWLPSAAPRWAPLAAMAAVGVAGLAAAAVACHRRAAVAAAPATPEQPPLPVGPPLPPVNAESRSLRGLLLAVALAVAVTGVWSVALLHNATADRACVEAAGQGDRWDTSARVSSYRYSGVYDHGSVLHADAVAVSCAGRR
ncbi:hypothetical protein [Actinoplanes xinjiangensis]|uniref:hypothetical protein n=1 Tax=Actinoplanes xinjiangensis TaxID=512350 RepID=UPI003429DB5B